MSNNNGGSSYVDFELEIVRINGLQPSALPKYRIAARSAGEGETHQDLEFENLADLENQAANLRTALLVSNDTPIQEFGRILFDTFLIGELRELFRVALRTAESQRKGLRLKLHIESPELAALPWEFLYDPTRQRFISLYNDTIIRYVNRFGSIEPLRVEAPLRILAMTASPVNRAKLDVATEKERIEAALKDLKAKGIVEITWVAGQGWRDLQKMMQRGGWHVFHFIGHGYFDKANNEGVLALAEENGEEYPLTARNLSKMIADPSLYLVVLNVCKGAYSDKTEIFSSTAATLTQQGTPAVLAMQYAISDRAAIELSRSFYEALAGGLPLARAVTEARKAINMATRSSEWGTPVLYTRAPDGVLFDIQHQKLQTVPQKARTPKEQTTPDEASSANEEALLSPPELRRLIIKNFSMVEFRELCQELDKVDFDSLGGESRDAKALELVEFMKRRGRLPELQRKIRELINQR